MLLDAFGVLVFEADAVNSIMNTRNTRLAALFATFSWSCVVYAEPQQDTSSRPVEAEPSRSAPRSSWSEPKPTVLEVAVGPVSKDNACKESEGRSVLRQKDCAEAGRVNSIGSQRIALGSYLTPYLGELSRQGQTGGQETVWGISLNGSFDIAGPPAFVANYGGILALGGGEQGVNGRAVYGLRAGLRAPVGETHGPFVAVGAVAGIEGDQKLWWSNVRFPDGRLGYHWLQHGRFLTFGLEAAPVLIGRYGISEESHRKLGGSWSWGPFVELLISDRSDPKSTSPAGLFLKVHSHRIETDGQTIPLQVTQAQLCANWFVVAACVDARNWTESRDFSIWSQHSPNGTSATYLGVSVGLGVAFATRGGLPDK